MILLDTDILIDADAYVFDETETYTASILSRAELELGVHRAGTAYDRQARQARLALLDTWLDWLEFDIAASRGYGLVAGTAEITGARLRNKDALIAGQAYSLGLPIMTHNTADYAPFFAHIVLIEPRRK